MYKEISATCDDGSFCLWRLIFLCNRKKLLILDSM